MSLFDLIRQTRNNPEINTKIKEYVERHPENLNEINEDGITPLIAAIRCSRNASSEETVKLLISCGADINKPCVEGCPPIMHAFCTNPESTFVDKSTEETLEILLKAGVDPNVRTWGSEYTTLMYVMECIETYSTVNTAKILLKYGADPNLKNVGGQTALSLAAHYCKDIEILEILLEAGAHVTRANYFGDDEFISLLDNGKLSTVDLHRAIGLFLENGLDINNKLGGFLFVASCWSTAT